MSKASLVPFLLLVSLAACGSAADEPVAAATLNAHCPIMGEQLDPDVTVDFDGGKVGFCCEKCVAKWKALDDASKQAALAAADG